MPGILVHNIRIHRPPSPTMLKIARSIGDKKKVPKTIGGSVGNSLFFMTLTVMFDSGAAVTGLITDLISSGLQ